MSVDYKLLLAKYIEHVGAEEGTTFIGRLYRSDGGMFEGYSERVKFTEEEVAALRECERQGLD
jgi:hypothetical protein